NRRDDLVEFARFESEMTCRAEVTEARWSRGGGLHLTVRVAVTRDGADALVFEPGSGRLRSLPFSGADLPSGLLLAGRELGNDQIELFLRDTATGDERRIAASSLQDRTSVTFAIDP
ncbi:hypothetical protein HER21_38110, partial [Pseudomonas sp. BGM005]|nr:hypothetical protein [Pseudomonas sp. BG5]